MSDKKAQRILEKWVADLKDKDRTRKAVSGNFDELFNEVFEADINFDTAYALLDEAVKAHLPSPGVARAVYKDLRKKKSTEKTEREFIDEWNKYIKDCAYQAFYSFYEEEKTSKPTTENKYGNMSAREYRAQRKYANAFPKVDLEALRKRAKEIEKALENDNPEDLLRLLDVKKGDSDVD